MQYLILLQNHKSIPQSLCIRVKKQVMDKFSSLIPDVAYTLKKICGNEFWDTLDKWEKIAAGQYMAEIVSKQEIPFVFGENTSSNSKTFIKL